jgi:pimeloyl-ACP methyl ester carboxylesterase
MTTSNNDNGKIFDVTIPPGENYDKAEFRLWLPDEPITLKGVLVAVRGSNSDSRPWVKQSSWKEFAESLNVDVRASYWHDIAHRHGLALLGCNFTDKPHKNMDIEEYCKIDEGSGQALLEALTDLAEQSGYPELSDAPLALWGASAGGQFTYEFACWRPKRTITFVLNKGGIYYTALASQATRNVPGILFIGERDSPFRNDIINGIFSVNRNANALWALTVEPKAVHEIGRSLELSEVYFDEVIPLRLPEKPRGTLRPLSIENGYLGDLDTLTYAPYDEDKAKERPAAWLPTEKMAQAWQAVMTGKPL